MTLRVVHAGTGNVGSEALRAILRNDQLELVGHYVSSPEKVGRDSGELVGVAPVGVRATGSWDEVVALDADCLSYFGEAMGRERAAILDLVPFLERGTNVVTFSGFVLAHPATVPGDLGAIIGDACNRGESTCFFTGIDPGWATSDLAIAALAAADRVDCVRVMELGWWGDYSSEESMTEYFGFGKQPGFQPLLVTGGFLEQMWAPTLHQLAEVLGREIEAFEVVFDTDVAPVDTKVGFGVIPAGRIVVVHFELRALSGGTPFAIVEHTDCVARDVGKQWPQPHGPDDLSYRIEVEGRPSFSVELNMGFADGLVVSAMPPINAIPAVCAAPPGLLGPLDVPRYWPGGFDGDGVASRV
jgi:2,4-diaminopentanoate dehydrogenase